MSKISMTRDRSFLCPYCGQENTLSEEIELGLSYAVVTDCQVCCKPVIIHVTCSHNEYAINVHTENE